MENDTVGMIFPIQSIFDHRIPIHPNSIPGNFQIFF